VEQNIWLTLQSTLATLRQRIAGFETQTEMAAFTDFPPAA
jgi:hypothetical protein